MADSGNDRVQVGGKGIASLLGVFVVFQFCGVFLGPLFLLLTKLNLGKSI